MSGSAPRWIAIPQPARFFPEGAAAPLWRPGSAEVVAESAVLEGEAARLRTELGAQGIVAGSGSTIRLRVAPEGGSSDASAGRAPGDAVPASAPGGAGASDESWAIEVGDDVAIVVRSPAGAFRAGRQLLHNLRAQGGVPRGRVEGRPAVAERGLHLDAARKHYPAGWIAELLHEAADVGINVLQWHFSENEGFRIASAAFPEVVSAAHVSRGEAEEIGRIARGLHIAVVPSLDMPGHLRQVLSAYPEHRLPPSPCGAEVDHALDITRDDAVDFALRLLDDMAEVFPGCTDWNVGGDEFVDFERMDDHPVLADAARARFGPDATGFDLLTAFVNRVAAHLHDRGIGARVWNDGMLRGRVVPLDPRIVLTWWTNWNGGMRPVVDAVEAGLGLVNVNDALLYYVLGEKAGYRYPTAERIWAADWHPGLFPALPDGTVQELRQPYPALLRGASFAIWSDDGEAQTPEEVAAGVRAPLRAMAERAWNGGSGLSLEEFVAMAEAIGVPTRADR